MSSASERLVFWNQNRLGSGFSIVFSTTDSEAFRHALALIDGTDSNTIVFECAEPSCKVKFSSKYESHNSRTSVSTLVTGTWVLSALRLFTVNNFYSSCYDEMWMLKQGTSIDAILVSPEQMALQFNRGPIVFLDNKFDPFPMTYNQKPYTPYTFPCNECGVPPLVPPVDPLDLSLLF